MLKIVFKSLEPSQIITDIITEKIAIIIKKFPSLNGHKMTITLDMENSPLKAGPDFFTVSSMVTGKKFKNLKIKKSSDNFFLAVALLADGLNEHLGKETLRLKKQKMKVTRAEKSQKTLIS